MPTLAANVVPPLPGRFVRHSAWVHARRLLSSQQQQQETQSAMKSYETLKVERVRDKVVHVELNRPDKRNSMNVAFWR